MGRTTQFVGLTTAASAFAETLEATDRYVGAHGMFGEDIELGRWRDADGNSYTEVVQADPWSSGPCIFTCIEMRWANEDRFIGEHALPRAGDLDRAGAQPPPAEAFAEIHTKLDEAADGEPITPSDAHKMLILLDACFRTRLFEWTLDPTMRDKSEWDHDSGAYWV